MQTAFLGMKTAPDSMGSSVQIRTNSTDACRRWLLAGSEQPQETAIIAEFAFIASGYVSTMVNSVPVVVTGDPYG